jgi:hypothetical protein
MKILFIGPSLRDASDICDASIQVRPPAVHGDVLAAVREGATAIGIVDGNFEHVAPVWHKEILHALDCGVTMFGAASMGALRAAECAAFGMIGVGRIYEDFASGRRVDDADVALVHGPAELGYPPLSIPLVNTDATIEHLLQEGRLEASAAELLKAAAGSLFYKERTWPSIVRAAGMAAESPGLAQLFAASTIDQKRQDALELTRIMVRPSCAMSAKRGNWSFQSTSLWHKAFGQPKA